MFRMKSADLKTLDDFIATLQKFKREKMEKWEKVDDSDQADILPGTPSEDWIIPPDENITRDKLMNDPNYRALKEQITSQKKEVQKIADFLDDGKANILDWLNFQNPLIGNVALEDCIDFCKKLKEQCQNMNYPE